MLLPDVNILVYAFREESNRHEEYLAWLTRNLIGSEPVGISELVLSGFVRIVTSRRIFKEPSTTHEAMNFCDAVLGGPTAVPVRPSPRHWQIFADLSRKLSVRANLVPDAYHAALAIDHDATWVTTDRDFAKFPGLRWATPLS